MPLARARCPECSEPLADPPHIHVPMGCQFCGRGSSLVFAADGTPVDFDASFTPQRLQTWFSAARRAMASGTPGLAVGFCGSCGMPMAISSKQQVSLPCPHCKKPLEGKAEELLLDQWVEPWTRAEGGGLSLEYRLAWVDDSTGITAGCAGCGAPTPADDPAVRCRRCGAVCWVERGEGDQKHRAQLGVRVDGTRQGRPFNVLVSLAQGEAMLRADTNVGAASSSSSSVLGITGIGCAIAVGLSLLGILGLVIYLFFK